MINKERIDIVLDQLQDLHVLVDGLKECSHTIPPFLVKMCDDKLEKVRKNLHLLVDEASEPIPLLTPVAEQVIEEEPFVAPIVETLPEEVRGIEQLSEEPIINNVEYITEEEEEEEKDDFDLFVQNLVQTSPESRQTSSETKNTDRSIIGEKFESQVLHEKIAAVSSERVVEQMIGKQLKVDLNKAISLNDKFRFQRELFQGNGAKMADTLNRLNQLFSQEESMKYIQKNFSWDDSNETVKYFYSILEKRFNA